MAAEGGPPSAILSGADGLEAEVRNYEHQRYVRVVVTRPSDDGAAAGAASASHDGGQQRRPLTWGEAISHLDGDAPSLRALLSQALRDMPFEAFFWECPPVSASSADRRRFEFVAVEAPHLARIHADDGPFAEHLAASRGKMVSRTFHNLGGDSLLVAPAQAVDDQQAYAHVASFFRKAPAEQQDAQWRTLGAALRRRLGEVGPRTNVWVSTEGSGVYWLHMRLDPSPKYYHFREFRSPPADSGGEEL